jgi:hypothetical protein
VNKPEPLSKEAMEGFFLKMRKENNLPLTGVEERKLAAYNAAREEKVSNESILTLSTK